METETALPDDRSDLAAAVSVADDFTKRRILDVALSELDFERYKEIRRQHADAKWRKFLDLTKWLDNKYERAAAFGLINSPPKRILDLGCGPGHFTYVCRHLGHDAIGVDVPGDELFRAINSFLGNRFEEAPVLPRQKLGDYSRLDLITALSANFYRRPDRRLFDEDDWRFFFDDIRSRLNAGGRILLHLNKLEDDEGLHVWDDAFRLLVEKEGGRLDVKNRIVQFTV